MSSLLIQLLFLSFFDVYVYKIGFLHIFFLILFLFIYLNSQFNPMVFKTIIYDNVSIV